MKITCGALLALGISLLVALGFSPQGLDAAAEANVDRDVPSKTATRSQVELEQKFRETFTNATLVGRWRLSGKDGKLGEAREETYSVQSVTKASKDVWLFNGVRVKYGGKDVTLPVPIPMKVLWAGDTPVISVTNLAFPGLGTYTARVMVYRGIYTGAWFASDHGGSMSGQITNDK